jgi:hypothetical protein
MPYNKPYIQQTTQYNRTDISTTKTTRTIYYGKVISIDDQEDGARIKVRILDLDNGVTDDNLPWCYPLLPRYFHIYPQEGEVVRIFIGDTKLPDRTRFWLGSIISQSQKISFDSYNSALSTSVIGISKPQPSVWTYPDADGVFPLKEDVALVGRVNTDIILSDNQVHLRAGKHENDDILKLNVKNPAEISLIYEKSTTGTTYNSNSIVMGDKIALISHTGTPKFKAARLTTEDREKIFNTGHPIARGDILVKALDIIRNALINHIHGYSNLPADKNSIVKELEKINFENILQKNIVIN